MAGLLSPRRAATIKHAPAPVPAGLANPAPARPCVGRWPFAPVLAPGQTLRSATILVLFGIRVRTLRRRDKISATPSGWIIFCALPRVVTLLQPWANFRYAFSVFEFAFACLAWFAIHLIRAVIIAARGVTIGQIFFPACWRRMPSRCTEFVLNLTTLIRSATTFSRSHGRRTARRGRSVRVFSVTR